MAKGAAELEEIFYNPEAYNMLAFDNRWEEETGDQIGYFCPAWKYKLIDKEGRYKE